MVYIDINILSDKIEFSIFRNFSNNKKILKRNEIIFPICYSSPQRLNYIRNLMGSFIEEYNIGHYKVNIGNLDRDEDIKVLIDEMREVVKIEGVLEEHGDKFKIKYENSKKNTITWGKFFFIYSRRYSAK